MLFKVCKSLFLVLCILSNTIISAQERTITGKITDASTGESIIGAAILIKNTTKGVVSDVQGGYSLVIPDENAVLIFSYVGYLTQEIPVADKTVINIGLAIDVTKIEEVVVIGYGTQKKEDLTGSIAVVDVEEMNKSNFTTFDQALQGRSSGVYVSTRSGMPGSSANIKIRGIGSISLNTDPLYVVDGIPINENILNSINPNDIESLHVLKDASATAIYGARGANGVVMITTNRGKERKPTVSFNSNVGYTFSPKTFNVMNAEQYSELMKAAYANFLARNPGMMDNYHAVYSDSARLVHGNINTDTHWQDEITQPGHLQNYNLSVASGNENANYYISGNYADESGILIDTRLQRFTLRANSDFRIGKKLEIGESVHFSRMFLNDVSHYGNGNPWLVATTTSPLMPVYDKTALGGYGGPTDTLTGANERTNPVAEQMLNDNTNLEYKILSSIYLDYEIIKGLKYSLKFGANYRLSDRRTWSPKYTLGNMRLRDVEHSRLSEAYNFSQDYLINNMLTYNINIRGHNLTGMAAWERTIIDWKWTSAVGKDITYPELPVLDQAESIESVGGGKGQHRLESWLGRIMYDYKGKYLLTASVRVDGSTRFGPKGGRYGTFPSFSLGWKVNEDFLQGVEQIDMLKIRFGWGQTGNENLQDYQYFALMDPLKNSRYNFGVNQDLWLGGASYSFQNNPLIKWEAAAMTNFGVDVSALGNKIQFTVEYYIKNQKDMLVKRPISVVFGKFTEYGSGGTVGAWVNLARVQNRGLEFDLTYREMERSFRYAISANFTSMNNEVIDLGVSDILTTYTIAAPGHTIGSFYGFVADGILQEDDFEQDGNGNPVQNTDGTYNILTATQEEYTSPGDIKFKDLNKDGKINDDDRTIIGKPLPDFVYGLNFDAWYKGFDFTIFFQGMQNMQIYNDHMASIGLATDRWGKDENKLVDVMNYWTPENPTNTQTRVDVIDENRNTRISSWFIEDASFVRIRTLQIGYSLPQTLSMRIGIETLRIFANANNLYTLTKYSGYDPEIGETDPDNSGTTDPLSAGIDYGFYPVPKSYTFGIQLIF
jgi:TonB-linked SusC/RagA family outer membrane protein